MSEHIHASKLSSAKLTAILALMAVVSVGCGSDGPAPANAKQVVPVTGTINVDGTPTEGVEIRLHPKSGRDEDNPTATSGRTEADGTFAVTTYYKGDGAPIGEYTATFRLLMPTGAKPIPDKFRGRYYNAATSEYSVSVTADQESIDMGVIELSSN